VTKSSIVYNVHYIGKQT